MRSVYIAGPYTGKTREEEDKNVRAAAEVAASYLKRGWAVFCPHTMTCMIDREFNKEGILDWANWMELAIYWLSHCDAVAFLPNWRKSKGATIEHIIAVALGKEIIYCEVDIW